MIEIINTFVFPIIRQDFILPAIDSLRAYTPPNFKVIVVNQTIPNQEFEEALYARADIVIRPHVNYGFAQGINIGARMAPTPLVTVSNDDVIFLENWFQAIGETFKKFPKAIAVAPMSPKEPGWGYGEPAYRYPIAKVAGEELQEVLEPYEAFRQEQKVLQKELNNLKPGDEKAEGIRERIRACARDIRQLQSEVDAAALKASQNPDNIAKLVKQYNGSVIDGIAMWLVVFRRKEFEALGMFEEKFFPGGGEDYDFCARSAQAGYRNIASSWSWVYHFWGQSKDQPTGFNTALPAARKHWNCLSTKGFGDRGLWHEDVDCWGKTGVRTTKIVSRMSL